jgi:hypothetical protein
MKQIRRRASRKWWLLQESPMLILQQFSRQSRLSNHRNRCCRPLQDAGCICSGALQDSGIVQAVMLEMAHHTREEMATEHERMKKTPTWIYIME